MKPEVYRRMKVAGRLFVLIGLSVPAVLILLLVLRMGFVVLAARECAVLAVGFILIGAVLWAGGWIVSDRRRLARQRRGKGHGPGQLQLCRGRESVRITVADHQ